ncbi:hypothetical protein EPUL_001726 [Erysiphe pulchra]|uniref:Reverse transcriptase domain-containing protein n=1 Tax=Erysiphe pulchra TaxID=225359 RepID=A0A2S4PTZ8_9PEZI|nr:hypothetical protein EPUL_001726 [Erysiphe pulchra]
MTEFVDDPFNDKISIKDSHKRTNKNQFSGDKALQASVRSPAVTPEKDLSVASQHNAVTLMDGIKGLLDLTNDYLRMLEEKHLGIGADFLALLADGASRAMRGERQSREDRRVMIRLAPDYEARKTGAFELRQKAQQLVPDKSLVSDVWPVPSGIAILAPTPAKAAAIPQSKTVIEDRFGNATVERQERWTSFIIGPIPKKFNVLMRLRDPLDGLLSEELAFDRDTIPIRYMNWTRRSQNDQPTSHIRKSVPESKSHKFPSRLRIFGEACAPNTMASIQQEHVRETLNVRLAALMYMTNLAISRPDVLTAVVHTPQMIKIFPLVLAELMGSSFAQPALNFTRFALQAAESSLKPNPQSSPDSSQLPPSSLGTETLISSQYKCISRPVCQELIDWYSSHNLHLQNPTETPTHNRGGTIDLAFCIDINAKCEVRTDLHTTSDHETLVTTIYRESQTGGLGKLRYRDINRELFLRLLGRPTGPEFIRSWNELEIEARETVKLIKLAMTGAFLRTRIHCRGTPWWNDECRQAAHAYNLARRMELRSSVRRAKKAYWNPMISDAKTLPDAFRIVRCHNNVAKYLTPPLRKEDSSDILQEPRAKALLLHKALLCRHLDTEDIPTNTPTVAQRQISWQPFSVEEAYRATCKCLRWNPLESIMLQCRVTILFLLYVEPLLRLSRGRFGYADDAAIFTAGKTLEKCNSKLQFQLDCTLEWGIENGISFDALKTDLQHFHRKRKYKELPIRMGEGVIKANDFTRWLGIFLDWKLLFKEHIRRTCQRARVVTDHITRLCNTTCGTSPGLLRQAIQGYAFTTLLYGAEIWYGRQTSEWAINQVQISMNRAARAVLSVYKTIQLPVPLRVLRAKPDW